MESSCFITNIRHFFLYYVENAPKMRRMRTLENYADPHHCILSDALNACIVLLWFNCVLGLQFFRSVSFHFKLFHIMVMNLRQTKKFKIKLVFYFAKCMVAKYNVCVQQQQANKHLPYSSMNTN